MNLTQPVSRRGLLAAGCLAFAALGLAPLAGCGGAQARKDAASSVESGLQQDLDSLTSLDSATAATLFDSDFTQRLVAAGVDPAQVYGPLFSKMTYSIDSIDVADDARSAVAHLTVTNVDVPAALESFRQSLTDYLYGQVSGDAVSTAQEGSSSAATQASAAQDDAEQQMVAKMGSLLADALQDPGLGMVSASADVSYVASSDQTWRVQDKTALVSALLGGLDPDQVAAQAGSSQPAGADGSQAADRG